MGAFRVHGVTEQTVINKINNSKQKRKKGGDDLDKIFEDIFSKMKPVQISEAFDAPQFCKTFIEIAQRGVRCRDLKIMVYAEKKNKDVNR